MITFWETILWAGMMLRNSLLCKSWLRLDSLTILSPVCKYFLRSYLISHAVFQCSVSGGNKNKLSPSVHFFACTSEWISLLERFLPRQVAITRAKRDWELDIISRFQLMVFIKLLGFTYFGLSIYLQFASTLLKPCKKSSLPEYSVVWFQEHLSKDDARQQFLRILRTLPYGNSVFFSVRKIDDPIGLLPGKIILGINKRGVWSQPCNGNFIFFLLRKTDLKFLHECRFTFSARFPRNIFILQN